MSQEQQELNGTSVESATETNVGAQVVPVSESIRYRKRAQAAEQQVEQLTTQLAELEQEHRAAKHLRAAVLKESPISRQPSSERRERPPTGGGVFHHLYC